MILIGCALAIIAPARVPAARFNLGPAQDAIGVVLFVLGLALRWYAILYLGRYFTVDVAIADDHRLIDSGPYRHVRHPSYSGALLAFLGLGLCMHNALSLLLLCVPTWGVLLWRIGIEEAALRGALGEHYERYTGRTKRLIPLLY